MMVHVVFGVDVVVHDERDRGVHDALGLAGRAAGVEDDAGIVGLHRLGRALARCAAHEVVPPVIASLPHRHVWTGPADHDDGLDRGKPLDRLVDRRLQWNDASAPEAGIGCDDHLRRVGVEPIAQRPGREPREDRVEEGADAKAREHGDDGFREVRCEDGDRVTLGDAQRLEHIGELVDFDREHPVGEESALPVFSLPDQGETVVGAAGQMSIDEVECGIADAAHEVS